MKTGPTRLGWAPTYSTRPAGALRSHRRHTAGQQPALLLLPSHMHRMRGLPSKSLGVATAQPKAPLARTLAAPSRPTLNMAAIGVRNVCSASAQSQQPRLLCWRRRCSGAGCDAAAVRDESHSATWSRAASLGSALPLSLVAVNSSARQAIPRMQGQRSYMPYLANAWRAYECWRGCVARARLVWAEEKASHGELATVRSDRTFL